MRARIVFDLDGTLIDSVHDLRGIANTILDKEGLAQISLEDARAFIGNGVEVFVTKLRKARGVGDQHHSRLRDAFLQRYNTAVHLTQIFPGVETALESLIADGHGLGICTNKPLAPTMSVLQHLRLDGYFQAVIGGDSLSVHKPDPAPLRAAFDALPPGPEIYVGDSEVDAETAQRAKVPFLLFTKGYAKHSVGEMPHTACFSDFAQLEARMAKLLDDMAN